MIVGSRLNGTTGARTQMSSIITGILIVLSIFFLLPWLHFLPKVRLFHIFTRLSSSETHRLFSPPSSCWSSTLVSSSRLRGMFKIRNADYSVLAEAPHEFLFFWRMRAWTDFALMTGTFILTLCFSIEVRPSLLLSSLSA